MAEYSGKRAVGGLGISRGGSGSGIRDKKHEDRRIQCCNRIGCSTRLHSMNETKVSNQERAKYPWHSFHPTSGNVGSASKPFSGARDHKKTCTKHQNQKFVKETFLAESSTRQGETQVSELIPATTGIYSSLPLSKDADSAVLNGSSMKCTVASNSRLQKQIHQRSRSGNQNTSSGSSVQRSFPPRNTNHHTIKPALQGQGAIAQRYSVKNLACTLISDVLPLGSSSDSDHDRRADGRKKRSPNGESSSRGKSITRPSTAVKSGMQRNVICGLNPSFPDRPLPQQATRRTRNFVATRDGVSSVRTQRIINGDTRTRLSNDNNDNRISFDDPVMTFQSPQTEFLISESVTVISPESFPRDRPSVCLNSYGQAGSSNHETARPIARVEDSSNQLFHSQPFDQDVFRHFEEVVLALERIGQDDELAYEQLLDLESNLLLGFQDQHRAMRLDIDNMSYEELLALEEKMGTVSTALTEEALSNCLKRSCYTSLPLISGSPGCGVDDTKCIICQEEYVLGEEVGMLGCEHRFHVVCIHQWLRLKNWCPICKSSVLDSPVS